MITKSSLYFCDGINCFLKLLCDRYSENEENKIKSPCFQKGAVLECDRFIQKKNFIEIVGKNEMLRVKLSKDWKERKRFFIGSISYLVFPSMNEFCCAQCDINFRFGIVIKNKEHAVELFNYEQSCIVNGSNIKYFSSIEERDIYQNS